MPTARIEFDVIQLLGQSGALLTHFRVRQDGAILADEPNAPLDIDAIQPSVQCFDTPGAGGEPVADVGRALWQSLQAHKNAAVALAAILSPGASEPSLRVSFTGHALAAKKLPWEALFGPDGFLCDRRVPIAREVAVTARSSLLQIVRDEELRFLAVIAAAGNDGIGEWQALKDSVLAPRSNLPVKLMVMTSKPAIREEIATMDPARVVAMPISGTKDLFLKMIGDFRPQIAHFFGHGFSGGGTSFLEIEDSSVENGGLGRHHLNASHMEAALSGSAWIVVLNACSLAAGSGAGTGSLAETMVARGIPAVIGMRDLVLPEIAHAFARIFHRAVLDRVADLAAGGSGLLDLPLCFADACRDIPLTPHGQPSDPLAKFRLRDWALPSLHVRQEPLFVDVIQAARMVASLSLPDSDIAVFPPPDVVMSSPAPMRQAEIQGEIDMLNEVLADRNAALTGPARKAIGQRIDHLRREAPLGRGLDFNATGAGTTSVGASGLDVAGGEP